MNAPRRFPRRFAATAIAALAAVSLVACGSDDDADDTPATAAPSDATTAVDAVTIEVDADSGTPGTQTVALGTPVSLHVTTATSQEFHLHGYDIEDEGTDVTITFVADQAGSFELESHDTEALLFTLVVTP
jgi:hypothetical protein